MVKFLILLKKEIKELMTLRMFLPLIAMVAVFSGLGNILGKEAKKNQEARPVWIASESKNHEAEEIAEFLKTSGFEAYVFVDKKENIINRAKKENVPFALIIPDDFGEKVKNFQPARIELYSIASNFSILAASKNQAAGASIALINDFISNKWIAQKQAGLPLQILKQPVRTEEHVVIGNKEAEISMAALMGFIQKQTTFIPIILFVVIVMAAQMVAAAVATEREDKTLETLLSLPIDRRAIVFAKLIAAGAVAILAAGLYMFGFNQYIKGVMGGAGAAATGKAIAAALEALGIKFGIGAYALLGATLFLGILVALSIAMILGVMTESVKDVQAITTPLMVAVLLPYILTLFTDINKAGTLMKYFIYAIPFSHPFLAAQKIITHDYKFIIGGIIYQLVVFLIFVVIAARIFSSDKVLTMRLKLRKPIS